MARQKLPNRRMNRTAELIYDGAPYAVTIGFHPTTGKLREVFTHGARTGSHMDALLDDSSILLSLLLQHGVEPASITAWEEWVLRESQHQLSGPSEICLPRRLQTPAESVENAREGG